MSESTTAPKTYKVGIITGSQRTPRAGPQITDFVFKTIESHLKNTLNTSITFDHIDVASLNLPLFDEPGIPQRITEPADYAHEHTRVWSARVAALDAFVFVTPQYNWGVPAGLKNAIDYLFNEWTGKPAMIVSYGGHGGDKCADSMKIILGGGLDMKVPDRTVNLSFPDRQSLVKAATGKDLGLSEPGNETWAKEKDGIIALWEETVGLLAN